MNLVENMGEIERFSRAFYTHDDLHGIGHVIRVMNNGKCIHEKVGGDWALIEAMIWLHDIGRRSEAKLEQHHAIISANLARTFLNKLRIRETSIEVIVGGILSHSFSIGGNPQTLEGKILSDADKLDAIGSVGIYRASVFQHDHNKGIKGMLLHFEDKLLKLHKKMYLPESKRIAIIRTKRLVQFKENLLDELGKKTRLVQ